MTERLEGYLFGVLSGLAIALGIQLLIEIFTMPL